MSAGTIFLTTPGFERALLEELGHPAGGRVVTHGAVLVPADASPSEKAFSEGPFVDPVFARQRMPGAEELRAASVAKMAEGLYDRAQASIDGLPAGFTIHAFTPAGVDPGLGSRAGLIGRELEARLRERRRRAWRRFVSPEDAGASLADVHLVVQVLLTERDTAWLSLASPCALARGGWDLAPWPGGIAPVAEDRRPPSRAYRKLEEAFLWMADEPRPGELCVDLGAAPGGWTHTALGRGARVIAVDRAALDAPTRAHPALRTIEGNAFTFVPEDAGVASADWLLSDVICEPARTLALVERWLAMGWCRKLVVTVKFKGDSGYGVLADAAAALRAAGCPRFRIKHLHHNKNEVTIMATAPTERAPQPATPSARRM